MTATAQNFNDSATPPPFPPEVVKQFLRHARDGSEAGVKTMLAEYGNALVKVRDDDGKGPVTHAIETGRKHLLPVLIMAGASIEERDAEGRTPLMSASRRGYVSMFSTLMSFGADINALDNNRWTPVMHAAFRERLVNSDGDALPVFMPGGKMTVLRGLLEAGVRLDVVDDRGRTVEQQAEQGGNKQALDAVRAEIALRRDTKADFDRRMRSAIDGFRNGYSVDLPAPPRAQFKKKYRSPGAPH